jgi:hypothetical protein
MSSVHAVTQNIVFTAKVASFHPLPNEKLIKEFQKWITEQAKDNNFIVYVVSMEGKSL